MYFEKFCWICSLAKSLKMLSDSISEGLIFQKFLGGMPPDPPRFDMLCMQMCFAFFQYLATLYLRMCGPPL